MIVKVEQKRDFDIKIYAKKSVYIKMLFGSVLTIFFTGLIFFIS